MNTRKIAVEYRLAHWAGIARERTESGLTIKAFCERAGFHENIYYYWQRKLRDAACARMAGGQTGGAPASLAPRGFTEVKISEQRSVSFLPEPGGQGAIRIEAAGLLITADGAYPAANLTALIKGLVTPC